MPVSLRLLALLTCWLTHLFAGSVGDLIKSTKSGPGHIKLSQLTLVNPDPHTILLAAGTFGANAVDETGCRLLHGKKCGEIKTFGTPKYGVTISSGILVGCRREGLVLENPDQFAVSEPLDGSEGMKHCNRSYQTECAQAHINIRKDIMPAGRPAGSPYRYYQTLHWYRYA